MFAVEFEVDAVNGKIKLPDDYKILINKHIKVVLMTDGDKGKSATNRFSKYLSETIYIDNFVMPRREERNAR